MTVLDGIAAAGNSLKAVDEPNRKVLEAVLTELSTGPLGTAPTLTVRILKEALGLSSPIERLIYVHARKTAEDEGFLTVSAI